ncbi:MAG TPA: cupredoxin family copper-binding protein [Candidatus Acidoferrum sp.]|nr:cupredoxin family copper-binding protein [Candidatus Acidoferrum sp.]
MQWRMTLAAVALGLSAAVTAAPAEQIIEIKDYQFVPQDVTVPAGTKLTWVNKDDAPHNIVQKDIKLRSTALDTGDAWSFVVNESGTYTYFCSLHPEMTGTITVEARQQ